MSQASDLTKQGITAVNASDKLQAKALFYQAVQVDPNHEMAWLWLSSVVDDDHERRTCLEKVLAINPNSEPAKRGIAKLTTKFTPLEQHKSPMPPARLAHPSKVPWYFSRSALIFTFLFLTPIWSILILADRKRQGVGVRIMAILVGVGYLWFFGTSFFGASGVTTVTGPSIIKFGTDYTETPNSVSVSIPKSQFSLGDQVAWVAQLHGPVKTTRVDLVLSRVGASGGEMVLNRSVLDIADPNFTILYGKFPLLFTQEGNYKLRIIYNDKSLAEGIFKVSK